MFERYTDRMRRMVVRSQELARERGHDYLGPEHLLLGLVDDEDAVGSQVLRAMDISLDEIRQRVDEIIGAGQGAPSGHIAFTSRAKKVLELGLREALQHGDNYIGTEHHLLALIREADGVAAQVLVASGADLNRARQQVMLVRSAYLGSGDTWPEDRPDGRGVVPSAPAPSPAAPSAAPSRAASISRFTDRARRVVVLAREEAGTLGHDYIGTEHILLGLLREGEGVAARALEAMGVSLEAARQHVEEIIGRGQQVPSGRMPFTPRARRVLELALREALQLGHNHIGPEHVLLGLIREGDGVAAQVLVRLGADLNQTRQQVIKLLRSASNLPRVRSVPMRRWAGQPLLGARYGRREAWWLLAACVVVTLAIGVAFAHQSTADWFDRVADAPVIHLLGGHPRLLSWMEEPGTQVPAVVLSLAMAVACLAARRLNGVVLALTAVLVATRLDEWLLKPLFHRTYLGAVSYPSGHTSSVVAIVACYVVLFLLPARTARTLPWLLGGLAVLLALLVITALGVIGLRWHYLTDVAGGAAVGVAAVCALCLLLDGAWRRLRLS